MQQEQPSRTEVPELVLPLCSASPGHPWRGTGAARSRALSGNRLSCTVGGVQMGEGCHGGTGDRQRCPHPASCHGQMGRGWCQPRACDTRALPCPGLAEPTASLARCPHIPVSLATESLPAAEPAQQRALGARGCAEPREGRWGPGVPAQGASTPADFSLRCPARGGFSPGDPSLRSASPRGVSPGVPAWGSQHSVSTRGVCSPWWGDEMPAPRG